ncbi:GAF domain-containing protein [Vibrio sp. SS-MA-C1-2]|uniref:GAF domain-containing protein n=1 Tax=Vibrio sp. SS-MA-C1-2 TaxID=2908646 RepID=UPI001F267696|nr:GAF domain-containing protein [Vibrio sp. SS-MA-C1-2]UJF18082.1 GAF domain-containing protein [Vibrio sp. SS-MA-C1-2]
MDKTKLYSRLAIQLEGLLDGESNMIANMANTSALLFMEMEQINWVGFYIFDKNEDELILGPFQGNPACVRIKPGKGVCGTAFATETTQRVDDVHQFAGHIACDAASNSEIVIPVYHGNQCIAVLDIDSPILNRFEIEDQKGLENLTKIVENTFKLD